jgi:hypothetical protein
MLALGSDNLKNTTIKGANISQETPDGFTTTAKLDGTQRTIGRVDSNYKLKSDLDTATAQREADKITNELTEALKPIDKSLASVKAMKEHIDVAQKQ